MPFSLIPDMVLRDYAEVTPRLLRRRGVSLLLCDLDYTLAPRSVKAPDDRLRRWIAELTAAGVTVTVLSNNRSPRRVAAFCASLGVGYIGHAGKPRRRGFEQAMSRAGRTAEETAVLGDKLLTDVLGAKRSGLLAIMVEPIGGPAGLWNHVLHGLQRPFKSIARRRRAAAQAKPEKRDPPDRHSGP